MSGFGQYASRGGSSKEMRTDRYRMKITFADLKRSQAGDVERAARSNKVRFQVKGEVVGGKFAGEKLMKTMDVAFGKSTESSKYAGFARFIEAVTRIPCGSAEQENVGSDELVGSFVDVFVKHANGYNNIEDFFEIEDDGHGDPPPQEAGTLPSERIQRIVTLAARMDVTTAMLTKAVEVITDKRTTSIQNMTEREADVLIERLDKAKLKQQNAPAAAQTAPAERPRQAPPAGEFPAASDRQKNAIRNQAGTRRLPLGKLSELILKVTDKRTAEIDDLYANEAGAVIEALNAMVAA